MHIDEISVTSSIIEITNRFHKTLYQFIIRRSVYEQV